MGVCMRRLGVVEGFEEIDDSEDEELEVGGPAADFRMSAFVSVTLPTLRQTFR